MSIPQAHVCSKHEECDCVWCGQFIAEGDWLYDSKYCSSACAVNDQQTAKLRIADNVQYPEPESYSVPWEHSYARSRMINDDRRF
jgi:hypothetical protein